MAPKFVAPTASRANAAERRGRCRSDLRNRHPPARCVSLPHKASSSKGQLMVHRTRQDSWNNAPPRSTHSGLLSGLGLGAALKAATVRREALAPRRAARLDNPLSSAISLSEVTRR